MKNSTNQHNQPPPVSPNHKSSIKKNYPTLRVICVFACFGGAIGGLIFGIFTALFLAITNFSWLVILSPITFAFLGMFLGFIPAALTGVILTMMKFKIANKISYIWLFFMGFLITVMVTTGMIYPAGNLNLKNTINTMLIVAPIGGLSAIITGYFFLPKADKRKNSP